MTTTKTLIDAISSGDAVSIETAFNAAMAEKISSKLDTMRMDVAKNMFASQEVSAEPVMAVEESFDLTEDQVDLMTEEQLDEVITKATPASKVISDFVKSDNPKFAGKSKKERIKMALGAYYAKHPEKSNK